MAGELRELEKEAELALIVDLIKQSKGAEGMTNFYNPDGLPVIPPLPSMPKMPADGAVAICGACGMRILRVMGYVCGRTDCPCFIKATCSTSSQAAQYLQTVDKGLIVDVKA